jgi:hypothetical protein
LWPRPLRSSRATSFSVGVSDQREDDEDDD